MAYPTGHVGHETWDRATEPLKSVHAIESAAWNRKKVRE